MKTKVQKWGNSLALRIPHALAADADVRIGSIVDVKLQEGKLVVEPISRGRYQLEDLLAGITKANIHSEIATGERVGREAW